MAGPDDLYRFTTPAGPTWEEIQSLSPCIVAQGRKSVTAGGETYLYDPFHYLILASHLHFQAEVLEASLTRPFLSFVLRIDPALVRQVSTDMLERRTTVFRPRDTPAPPARWRRPRWRCSATRSPRRGSCATARSRPRPTSGTWPAAGPQGDRVRAGHLRLGEAFTALNLVLAPTLDDVLLTQLGQAAKAAGDELTWLVTSLLAQDSRRRGRWSRALADLAVTQCPDSRAALGKWIGRWAARADEAALGLGTILEETAGIPAAGVAEHARAARERFLDGLS